MIRQGSGLQNLPCFFAIKLNSTKWFRVQNSGSGKQSNAKEYGVLFAYAFLFENVPPIFNLKKSIGKKEKYMVVFSLNLNEI